MGENDGFAPRPDWQKIRACLSPTFDHSPAGLAAVINVHSFGFFCYLQGLQSVYGCRASLARGPLT
jgi:hypothetical protein